MYVQMAVVGFLLASILYGGAMITFLSRYVAGPIPELQFVGGKPGLLESPGKKRLPIISLLKYYVSLNPKNYVSIRLNSKSVGVSSE